MPELEAPRVDDEGGVRPDRGAPLVVTWGRWAACVGVTVAVFAAALHLYRRFTHADMPLATFLGLVAFIAVANALLVLALLRAEEARVTRELRVARTGTAMARSLATRRRQQAPFLARLYAVKLGTAAVFLADGDRGGAVDVLVGGSPLMRGGRLDRLRDVVGADLERATGTSVGLERCVQRLRAMVLIGHREADLYRTHVLVKALLEQGDAEGAVELIGDLERAGGDDEQLLYATWLRVWFDLDAEAADYRSAWPPLPEAQLRLATLMARAHGADKLVEKLEERVSSIARRDLQG